MKSKIFIFPFLFLTSIFFIVLLSGNTGKVEPESCSSDTLLFPGEKHFRNIRMLTNGGENAEAYFSFDGTKIIFQSTREPYDCDQIFIMNLDGSNLRLVSTGKGRTTCSYFMPDGKLILYSSTHLGSESCPQKPDFSRGYVWALYKDYDIFISDTSGKIVKQLTSSGYYDAEATVSPKGDKIVFTSTRDGDIELYSMNPDGSNVKRLTDAPGYDGGAFFSYDGEMIVFRASRFDNENDLNEYRRLLEQGLVRPSKLDIYVMNSDGTNIRRLTNNGAANFGPYFFPDNKRIIFSSNMDDPGGRNFELYMINIDGTGLERVTFNPTFDGFPMFALDGSDKFIFCSNRFNSKPGETNVFLCEWVE
ncbi:MAG: hypothetical protein N2510_04055 [Ignavibacteria bacterium]|nr:hypothetical protein [Ignavibacteria bacterium]